MSGKAVNPEQLASLTGMGFSEPRATRALRQCTSVETALNWLLERTENESLDLPLEEGDVNLDSTNAGSGEGATEGGEPKPDEPPRVPLTEEEKKERLAELQEKMRKRREDEQKMLEQKDRDLEKRRVNEGKEMARIREERRLADMKKAEEEHRRKKAEEARAMQRVQNELAKDRLERFGTEHEREKARAQEEERIRREDLRKKFAGVFEQVKNGADKPTAKKAAETLQTLIGNAMKSPTEEKFRKIRTTNPAFQSRVGALPGGIEYLQTAGFVQDGEFLELQNTDQELLLAAHTELGVQLLYL